METVKVQLDFDGCKADLLHLQSYRGGWVGRVVSFSTRILAEGDFVAAKVKPASYKNRGVHTASKHVPGWFEVRQLRPGRVPGLVSHAFRGVKTLLPKAIKPAVELEAKQRKTF